MARLRTLKPGFFHNEELAELKPHARLLFAGLWTIADKEGRLEDRPKRIKAEVFPYEDVDVDGLLGQLADKDFITRYQVDGLKCIVIDKWHAHQRPHPREADSVLPAPPKERDTQEGREKVVTEQDLGTDEPGGNLSLGSGNLSLGSGVRNLEIPTSGPVGDSPFVSHTLRTLVETVGVQRMKGPEIRVLFAPPDEQVSTIMDWWPKRAGVKQAEGLLAALSENERLIVLRLSWTLHRLLEANPSERKWVRQLEPWVRGRRFEEWRDGWPELWAKKGLRCPVPWRGYDTLTELLVRIEEQLQAYVDRQAGDADSPAAPDAYASSETPPAAETPSTPPQADRSPAALGGSREESSQSGSPPALCGTLSKKELTELFS